MPLKNKRSGGNYCTVSHCNSSSGKMRAWKSELCELHGECKGICCKQKQPYRLHTFPKRQSESDIWADNLKRPNFKVKINSRVSD